MVGGFITFTTLEYRICVRSVTFYVTLAESQASSTLVFGVYGTNDNTSFTLLSVIDLMRPKDLYQNVAGNFYQDNQDNGDKSIQGYVQNTVPFGVYDNKRPLSVFYGIFYSAPSLSSDTGAILPPRTFTFQNDTCYSSYMLKHLPQRATAEETFTFFVAEIEWG